MELALHQASKVLGNTKKNPAVGCVIVKNGTMISAGSTGLCGTPHAEKNAIIHSRKKPINSDLYVTLEPCSHYGKTPPCVKSIIKNKIKRVFFSINDPDIRSYNRCKKIFKKNNINAESGLLSKNIKIFYKSYFKFKKKNLPYVTAKIATSKDFYTNSKKKRWITNNFSRGRVHLMRSNHDCILTSAKTVINDNPMLTCRINGLEDTSPARIILDKNLKILTTSNLIISGSRYRTYVFFNRPNKKKINTLKKLKIRLIKFDLNNDNNFDLKEVLKKVKQLGFSRIFLESGLELTTKFLANNLIDNFQLFISNKKLGSNGLNSFKKCMKFYLSNKKPHNKKVNLLGDKLISYQLK